MVVKGIQRDKAKPQPLPLTALMMVLADFAGSRSCFEDC